ncbi:hypothetical protein [Rathayibacter agropyri]|uniref:hypothetical protein n=1 Tax=Rathayibacter agropyri TaxID=1634927 RepID=UPI001564E71B|nr:hypothetical protein [Rathayibacter agropyri]NRD09938.1 hypothetical protein [Rathayibacter agropyri]
MDELISLPAARQRSRTTINASGIIVGSEPAVIMITTGHSECQKSDRRDGIKEIDDISIDGIDHASEKI